MICIQFCCTLVFLAIFASVFADECTETLNEDCLTSDVMEFVTPIAECFGDGTCDKDCKDPKKQPPECRTCLANGFFAIENEWCQCVLQICDANPEMVNDDGLVIKAALCVFNFVTGRCPEAVEYIKGLAKEHQA